MAVNSALASQTCGAVMILSVETPPPHDNGPTKANAVERIAVSPKVKTATDLFLQG